MEFVRKNVNASSNSKTSGGNGGGIQGTATNTTLETHTIFGQPYNGTNDVKGDLSDVNKITANGDISTDGKLIIKGVDDEGTYNDKDLNIAKEDDGTKFTSGEGYVFDNLVTATKFKGDIESDNGYIKSLGADSLASSFAYLLELMAENGTINNLTSTKILANDISVDTLTVTKAAHFFSLIIDEIKSVGGQIILSPANATLDIVKKIDSGNFKCYFRSKIGDEEISNQFAAKDQVVCQTFNVAEGASYNVSNTFYWRLLTSRGRETINGIEYHYIILSGSDCAANSGEPKQGDRVVALGNRSTKDRQNAIVLSAYNSDFLDKGLKAPSLVQYSGINDYTLSTHRMNVISNGLNQFIGNFKVSSGESITDLIDNNKYNKLILDKATAIVGADDVLKVDISGQVLPISDKKYIVEIEDSTNNGKNLTVKDNAFSYTNDSFDKNYSKQEKKVTFFSIILSQDGKVIERINIPVTFETGAILSVMDDKIESAVQGVQGDISRVEQKADSITTIVQNMKVGGKNLLDDSEFSSYKNGSIWTKNNGQASTVYGYKGQIGVHAISKPSNVNSYGYLELANQAITNKLEPNTYYTLSFYAKGINGTSTDGNTQYKYKGRITTYIYPDVGVELSDNAHTFYTTSKWQRYSYTFKTLPTVSPSNSYNVLFRLLSDVDGEKLSSIYYSNCYICMPKLEEGTMATAWDSSDEDMKSYITQKADSIEAKIVSEDKVKSMISQNQDSIKAEVFDEMNKATGIDIANGSITLNADKTTINGNLNIRNADEGMVLYDQAGNAKVMVLNKKIPTINNLDTSQSQMRFIQDFTVDTADAEFYDFDSTMVNVGTYKVGDTFTLDGSCLAVLHNNNKQLVKLNDQTYIVCNYCLINKTTDERFYSTNQIIKTTGTWDTNGNRLQNFTYKITKAGDYQVFLVVGLYNPDRTTDYTLGWLFFTTKSITNYTLIGTDGLVSVKGENQYLYYGDDGFIVRGYDYNGLRVRDKNYIDTVISYNDGKTLWGNLNSNLRVAPLTTMTTFKQMQVVAGTQNVGARYVVRCDSDFYNMDAIVIRYAPGEIWIKLPTAYEVDGNSFPPSSGKTIKIKNISDQNCYVYVQDSGYKIYAPDSSSNAYYYNIGKASSEFLWTGNEWLWFRCN